MGNHILLMRVRMISKETIFHGLKKKRVRKTKQVNMFLFQKNELLLVVYYVMCASLITKLGNRLVLKL